MCGLAGFSAGLFDSNFRNQVVKEIAHRGPDSTGFWADDYIELVHTRLAIISPNSEADQPMCYDDLVVVFNGEIYNFEELRDELIELGYKFELRSDTEVILKAYKCWGPMAFAKFNGMFAIAIYNTEKHELILARDPLGVKPLYYYICGNKILFASELRPFFIDGDISKTINHNAIADYLRFGYITHNRSILEDVVKLAPGSYLKYKFHDLTIAKEIYHVPKKGTAANESGELNADLLSVLIEGCTSRLIADVPVGILLSGGYDSSSVAAICATKASNITAYTMGFNDPRHDESLYASKVASYLKLHVKKKVCELEEVKSLIPQVSEALSEPMADSSILPTMMLSRFVREDVKVVLSADGGDELFAGYARYPRSIKLWSIIKTIPGRKFIGRFMAKYVHLFQSRRVRKLIECSMAADPVEILESVSSIFTLNEINSMLLYKHNSPKLMRPDDQSQDWRQNLLDVDIKNYLAEDILVKVDRATMSVGLEAREPLLDKNLVAFAHNIPFDSKIHSNGSRKYILKKLTHQYLPRKLMERKKMGFSVPMSDWLRSDLKPLVLEYLDEDFVKQQKIFEPSWIKEFIKNFYSNRHDDHEKLWTLVLFQIWYKRWFQQNAA